MCTLLQNNKKNPLSRIIDIALFGQSHMRYQRLIVRFLRRWSELNVYRFIVIATRCVLTRELEMLKLKRRYYWLKSSSKIIIMWINHNIINNQHCTEIVSYIWTQFRNTILKSNILKLWYILWKYSTIRESIQNLDNKVTDNFSRISAEIEIERNRNKIRQTLYNSCRIFGIISSVFTVFSTNKRFEELDVNSIATAVASRGCFHKIHKTLVIWRYQCRECIKNLCEAGIPFLNIRHNYKNSDSFPKNSRVSDRF